MQTDNKEEQDGHIVYEQPALLLYFVENFIMNENRVDKFKPVCLVQTRILHHYRG